jgi:hypothetical protein
MEEKPGTRRVPLVWASLALLGVLGLSALLIVLALGTAGGVTYLGGTSYRVEFANTGWWEAGFLLSVPICLASWRHPRLAAVYVVVALGPQVVLPVVVAHRYAASGWGDGLEALGYVFPILMAPLFAAAAVLGVVIGRRTQRTQAV